MEIRVAATSLRWIMMGEPDPHLLRTTRTAELVAQLHAIVVELEAMHPGRKFSLDGHLVGSIGEAAAEAMFTIRLQPPSSAGTMRSRTTGVTSR
jgi:hypothetical protein